MNPAIRIHNSVRYILINIPHVWVFLSVLLGLAYKHIGCYRDEVTNRDLNGYELHTVDLVTCAGQCRNLGYPYVGLQAAERCFCGMTYGKHGATIG